MRTLKLALDWTPNVNHIGFFVAREKGFYKDSDIVLEIIDPDSDNYALTPAKKVENGEADFALTPTESLISYRTKHSPFDLIGIATIFQRDLSAIIVRSDSRIESPKDLNGRNYASYQARYEDLIVKEMIKNDGGEGNLQIDYPPKLGIWNTILDKSFDSTWIFLNWEGVEAEALVTPLNYFRMEDYHIPYSYSPLLVASQNQVEKNKELYKAFIKATKKGFTFCLDKPEEAAKILRRYVPESDKKINLRKALDISVNAFGSKENWGRMKEEKVQTFLDWIYEKGLETKKLKASDIITNELL